MGDHSLDKHLANLHSLCRICGMSCKTKGKPHLTPSRVANNISEIQMAYGVNVENDSADVHSKFICKTCHGRISRIQNHGLSSAIIDRNREMLIKSQKLWAPFEGGIDIMQCTICHHHSLLSKGGRPKKSGRRTVLHDVSPSASTVPSCSTTLEAAHPFSDSGVTVEPISDPLDTIEPISDHLDTVEPISDHLDTVEAISYPLDTVEPISYPLDTVEAISYPLDTIEPISYHVETEEVSSQPDTPAQATYTTPILLTSKETEPASIEIDDENDFDSSNISFTEMLFGNSSATPASNIVQTNLATATYSMLPSTPSSAHVLHEGELSHTSLSELSFPGSHAYSLSGVTSMTYGTSEYKTPTKTTEHRPPLGEATPTPRKSEKLIHRMLHKSLEVPLSKVEEKLLTRFVKRKLHQTKDKKTLTVKTGGLPMTLVKISNVRKKSGLASSPLKRKRAKTLKLVRQKLAGFESADEEKQQSSELKSMAMKKREKVCAGAGIRRGAVIKKKYGLALKTQLGISWTQHRKQKRMLRKVGITFQNELKERKEQATFVPKINEITLQGSESFTVTHVEDLCHFVTDLLERYSSANLLTWHDGHIPENEVWMKVGGDYGRKSFKLALEILNVKNPNSPDNTFPILVANVKDTTQNLVATLRHYTEQIKNLQHLQWKDKQIRLFLFGDYDFLCKAYGHQGATSAHPCLWCLAKKEDIQTHATQSHPQRTLDKIQEDCKNFKETGQGRLIKAKHFNNIIREPLLSIPLDHVAPPYLHILLGIVKKHHDILEIFCNDMDKQIARDSITHLKHIPSLGTQFDEFVKIGINLNEKKMNIEGCIAFRELTGNNTTNLYDELEEIEGRMEEHTDTYSDFEGPLCKTLQQVLESHRIVRQAYHSNSFVGNHCHKYLKDKFLDTLVTGIRQTVLKFSNNTDIISNTFGLAETYKAVLHQFSEVHKMISHTKPISEFDIELVQMRISEYIRMFTKKYSHVNLIPKQHLLECHCSGWMQKFGFGMAFHGEQGGERLHAQLNRIKQSSRGILRVGDRMKYIMKTAITKNAPELRVIVPPVNTRRKKIDSV